MVYALQMGIRGLQTLINERIKILQSIELKNCNIVLDGNSILHQIYTKNNLSCVFGGEYEEFYSCCFQLFKDFKAYGIKVVVVFDGAHLDDRKLETSLDRAGEHVVKSSSTNLNVQLSPLLLRQVFINVLDTFEIPYMSALGEGDGECASLANHLNAFVIAQDSDYFCYELIRGYIPFDSVKITSTPQGPRLTAQSYHIDSLLKVFPGLHLGTLILACCLCGNDYINRDLTRSILDHLVRRVYMPREIENDANIQTKYLYVSMQWMRKFDHSRTALQETCDLMNTSSRQSELQNQLRIIGESYFIPPDTLIDQFKLPGWKFIRPFGEYPLIRNRNNSFLDVRSKAGRPIPKFLCDAVSNLSLSPFFIEILIHRRLICNAHIEVEHEPSIYEHAIPLIAPCLAILLKWDEEHKNPLVDIYQRVGNQLKHCSYSLRVCIDGALELEKIKSLSINEGQHFVRKYFNLPNNVFQQWNHVNQNYHLWLMIIRYWYVKRHCQPVFLYALIVCLVKSTFLRTDNTIPLLNEQVDSLLSAFGNNGKRPQNPEKIILRLNEMCNTVIDSTQFDNSIVYELNCLQTIFMYSSYLNEFFNKPFPSLIHPHDFISGKLYYAFVYHYKDHRNLSDVLSDIFSHETVLLDFVNNFYRCIHF